MATLSPFKSLQQPKPLGSLGNLFQGFKNPFEGLFGQKPATPATPISPVSSTPIFPTPTGAPIPTPVAPQTTPFSAPVVPQVKTSTPTTPVTPVVPQNDQINAIREQALKIQSALAGMTDETAPTVPTTPTMPVVSPETQKAVSDAEKAVADASIIGTDELTTQEDIDRLIESTQSAFRGIQDKPIPLEFITGQLASVERRALGLAEPLERKLARLQAQRTSSLEASKFALERADKAADTERASSEFSITRADKLAEIEESARRFGVEQKLAQDKFDEDVRQFGLNYAQTQQKLDAADAKAAKSGDPADAVDALKDKIGFITEISSHPGLNSRVGPTSLSRRAFAVADKFGAGQDFAGSVRQLASQEFLDKLIAVKAQGATFGALTDREGDALRAAATKINDWEIKDEKGVGIGEWNVDEKSFKKELEKIQTLAQKALDRAGGTTTDSEGSEEDQLRKAGYTEEQIKVIKNS